MKKILVPVDFSDHTETVCRYALEIAKKEGGELRLFHAYFDYVLLANSSFPFSADTNELFNQEVMFRVREEAKTELQKIEDTLVKEISDEGVTDVKIVHTLTGGIPEEEILNIAETWEPDLIIMGTRGKGDKDILTGKVSSKVVKNANCRIMTVPVNARYHGFRQILYATSFEDEDENDLKRLFELIISYNPVVHCVHVNIDKDKVIGGEGINILKEHFHEEIDHGKLIFKVIENDDFLEGINEYVKENQIDLICLVHYRKSFLKRLFTKDHTRELLYHSEVPLYIFPGTRD